MLQPILSTCFPIRRLWFCISEFPKLSTSCLPTFTAIVTHWEDWSTPCPTVVIPAHWTGPMRPDLPLHGLRWMGVFVTKVVKCTGSSPRDYAKTLFTIGRNVLSCFRQVRRYQEIIISQRQKSKQNILLPMGRFQRRILQDLSRGCVNPLVERRTPGGTTALGVR